MIVVQGAIADHTACIAEMLSFFSVELLLPHVANVSLG